ncbi:hypothetical protein OBBRIDRAFT_838297 [Obba rivulosa]|uniref:Uncharacterized protein n=1 Tax=Obba rivulosa TaxID=1052685 RepID=A0A8E2AQ24_9APHY|nr:hypothetical protein OBBRIDRAFT_838297 [Obba rivulosa]
MAFHNPIPRRDILKNTRPLTRRSENEVEQTDPVGWEDLLDLSGMSLSEIQNARILKSGNRKVLAGRGVRLNLMKTDAQSPAGEPYLQAVLVDDDTEDDDSSNEDEEEADGHEQGDEEEEQDTEVEDEEAEGEEPKTEMQEQEDQEEEGMGEDEDDDKENEWELVASVEKTGTGSIAALNPAQPSTPSLPAHTVEEYGSGPMESYTSFDGDDLEPYEDGVASTSAEVSDQHQINATSGGEHVPAASISKSDLELADQFLYGIAKELEQPEQQSFAPTIAHRTYVGMLQPRVRPAWVNPVATTRVHRAWKQRRAQALHLADNGSHVSPPSHRLSDSQRASLLLRAKLQLRRRLNIQVANKQKNMENVAMSDTSNKYNGRRGPSIDRHLRYLRESTRLPNLEIAPRYARHGRNRTHTPPRFSPYARSKTTQSTTSHPPQPSHLGVPFEAYGITVNPKQRLVDYRLARRDCKAAVGTIPPIERPMLRRHLVRQAKREDWWCAGRSLMLWGVPCGVLRAIWTSG